MRLFDSFWDRCPALYYSLFILFGALGALAFDPLLFVPLSVLLLHRSWRALLALVGGLLFWFYVSSSIIYPPDWADGVEGVATFEVVDWTHEMRYNRPYCKMKLFVHSFEAKNSSFYAQNIPCRLSWSHIGSRPKAGFIYKAESTLSIRDGNYSIKMDSPRRLRASYSLAEWRSLAKSKVKIILAKFLPVGDTRAFLEGVLIGEFHDTHLKEGLKRFGLQHITVVSGFHFSLIAVILAAFFRLLLPWKYTNLALIIATTAYLLFIGPSASVLRAWVACSLLFLSKIVERDSNGLNALGVGLIVVLTLDPTAALELGFQLSFLATFAILLLYPLFDPILSDLFPKRSATELLEMPFSEQLTFVLLRFFTASFALILSVSVLMLPMSLYAFGEFPLFGIIYNAFFPFLVSIGVFVVSIAFLFIWFEPICAFFFQIAAAILDAALTLVTHAPSGLDANLTATWLTGFWLVLYLLVASFFSIIFYQRRKGIE